MNPSSSKIRANQKATVAQKPEQDSLTRKKDEKPAKNRSIHPAQDLEIQTKI